MKHLNGSFSNLSGWLCLGKHIGIKKEGLDFGLLYCDQLCTAATVYTQNQVKGAPLQVTREHLANQKAQAVVVNSGIANVATGEVGLANARLTTELVASELGIKSDDVLVASTGVIGPQLPMDKFKGGIKGLKAQLKADGDFAEAIMTTDTLKKEICIEHQGFKIAGAAKGSGMIAPNMATMLVFLATDADIAASDLSASLKTSVAATFNMMSVDMDTSTSDMAILLASGHIKSVKLADFQEALNYVCKELAKAVAADGEGATKLITAEVKGAASLSDARKVARSIIASNLVKTAVHGNDPNWGRLMMAIGNSQAENLESEQIQIWINKSSIVQNGIAAPDFDPEQLSQILKSAQEVDITIDLQLGEAAAEAYGCDMSEDYIKINAEYTT